MRFIAMLLAFHSAAWGGLIFDNGSGQKNDTLVIQFCLLDSAGARYTLWDTAYVVQAYGSVKFNIDTLLTPASVDLDSIYPGNLMFEYRLLARDSDTTHLGPYTWWVLLVDYNNGTDTHQMHKGSYYVNADPIEDFFTVHDDMQSPDLDTLRVKVDSIRWALGMPVGITGEKYGDNLHKKIGAYSGESGDNNNVKDDIAALSLTGGGSEACTILVKENGITPVSGARIIVRTLDQTAVRVPGLITDINGRGITELDAASYFISVSANNYAPLLDTMIVFRDSTWMLAMTQFDPGSPVSPDLCRVYGWIYDISGNLLSEVTITAEIPSEYYTVKYGNAIITPFEKSVSTDSLGYWQIDLFPNSVLSDSTSQYQFTVEYPSGVVLKSRVAVPDSLSWQFR